MLTRWTGQRHFLGTGNPWVKLMGWKERGQVTSAPSPAAIKTPVPFTAPLVRARSWARIPPTPTAELKAQQSRSRRKPPGAA